MLDFFAQRTQQKPSNEEILNANWNFTIIRLFGKDIVMYFFTINSIRYEFSFDKSWIHEWLIEDLSNEEFNYLKLKLLSL